MLDRISEFIMIFSDHNKKENLTKRKDRKTNLNYNIICGESIFLNFLVEFLKITSVAKRLICIIMIIYKGIFIKEKPMQVHKFLFKFAI